MNRQDLGHYVVAVGCCAFLIALFAILPALLQITWACVLGSFVLSRILRGKMDGECGEQCPSDSDALTGRGGSHDGLNIDHSTLV